jgi:manganese transport protein
MAKSKNRKLLNFRSTFKNHRPLYGALDIFKYIGPGLIVTVGFIDPGNWAANLAAGSGFGYRILWILTLSTIILIILQHNVAHLGIATGLCLSEATNKYVHKRYSKIILSTGMMASVSTSLAEILGGAIGLNMLFRIPLKAGAVLVVIFVLIMLYTNSYRAIEKWIIAFVSIIGLSFIYELSLVHIDWGEAAISLIKPTFPAGSMIIIMSVLGAVVMPHNLFLHSEIIQSRQWNLEDKKVIRRQLDYEFLDTFISMIIGLAINSAIILLAASTFFSTHTSVGELQEAQHLLEPLLGSNAAVVFAIALLFSGISSSITSGMAAGSIFAGFFNEPLDIKDNHSRLGVLISLVCALIIIFLISDPFKGLILSQMLLSMQLPVTIYTQIYLTSSGKVMGEYKNTLSMKILLHLIAAIVTGLNIMLLVSFFR